MKSIAQQLRQKIKKAKSLNSVAKAIGVRQSVLWRFVQEGTDPKLSTAEKLLEHFGYYLSAENRHDNPVPLKRKRTSLVTAAEPPPATKFPEVKSLLQIKGALDINSYAPRPNIWWRFWQFVFFGFRWEKVK